MKPIAPSLALSALMLCSASPVKLVGVYVVEKGKPLATPAP